VLFHGNQPILGSHSLTNQYELPLGANILQFIAEKALEALLYFVQNHHGHQLYACHHVARTVQSGEKATLVHAIPIDVDKATEGAEYLVPNHVVLLNGYTEINAQLLCLSPTSILISFLC
jgi:hypothetical protein